MKVDRNLILTLDTQNTI